MYSTGKKVQSQTNSQVLLCTEDILPLHCVGVLSKLNGTISVNLKILNMFWLLTRIKALTLCKVATAHTRVCSSNDGM